MSKQMLYLSRQNEQNQRELAQQQATVQDRAQQRELDPVYDTIGGGTASIQEYANQEKSSKTEEKSTPNQE